MNGLNHGVPDTLISLVLVKFHTYYMVSAVLKRLIGERDKGNLLAEELDHVVRPTSAPLWP